MLTGAGKGVLALAILATAGGIILRYPALIAIAVVLATTLVVGVLIIGRPIRLGVERTVRPNRVRAGDPAVSELTITNLGTRSFSASILHERLGQSVVAVSLPALEPGESTVVRRELPTRARGVFAVGPLNHRRSDPFGLVGRGHDADDTDELIVHPVVHEVLPFPAGVARDLDGTPSGEAAEGGVAFSGLREYAPGDDLRLVHWKSSARAQTLMVRHNVDVHQPRTGVILDTRESVYDSDAFEDAVRCVASILSASMLRRFPFILRTTDGQAIDDRSSGVGVLDFLARLNPSNHTNTLATVAGRAAQDPAGLSLACITGRATVADLRGIGPLRTRFEAITIVRLGPNLTGQVHELAGAVLMNAPNSTDFARAWNRRIRR